MRVQWTIKNKIIGLIGSIGILFILLVVFASAQARRLASNVLHQDIAFTSELLSENLALGMQTRVLDGGATLEQTLNLVRSTGSSEDPVILNVLVYDTQGALAVSLADGSNQGLRTTDELTFQETGSQIQTWGPMRDSEGNRLGTVSIVFSKKYINARYWRFLLIFLLTTLAVVAGLFFGGMWMAGGIIRRIEHATALMQDIAQGEGDLTKRLPDDSTDEVGQMNHWVNAFMDKLHELVVRVRTNTEQVGGAATKIAAAARELASGAEEQSHQSSEVAASVEEMTASITQNAQNAGLTARISEDATARARRGTEVMQMNRAGMEEIVQSTNDLLGIVKTLKGRADQIGTIVMVIDKIADQTNLLALNAAVEAARAGEQGAGFAVVADEVRRLAERTTDATRQISETVEAIQSDTRSAAESMDLARASVLKGKEAALKTEAVLDEIVATVNKAMDMIQQIAAASEEQSAGAEEISSSMDSISTVIRRTAANTDVVAKSTVELDGQTRSLMGVIGQFKLRKE